MKTDDQPLTPGTEPGGDPSAAAPGAEPASALRLAPSTAPGPRPVAGLALDLVLIALIITGVVFRFSWNNWNEDASLHPDEYGLTGTLTQLRIPDSLGEYFNTRLSPLSPYQKYDLDGNPIPPSAQYPMPDNRMRWGQWPLTIIRWVAEVTDTTDYDSLRLMGRRLSAGADALALVVIFFIGQRLYGRRVGLLAAALSALAVMQIQQSHFMTADNFGTLFTALSMWAAVMIATEKRQRADDNARGGREPSSFLWYALFGVFFGMALASRINLAPLAAEVVVAAAIAYAPAWQAGRADRGRLLTAAAMRLALAGVLTLLTFRVTHPMAFRATTGDTTILTIQPNKEWLESLAVAQAESSGEAGGPPGEQWTNRTPLVFPFVNMVVWGMGLPLGLLAWAGLAWATWRAARATEDSVWMQHALPLTWGGGYFLFMGTRWVKSIRYFLPIYPFLALFAAWAVVELWRLGQARTQGQANQWSQGTQGAPRFDDSLGPGRSPLRSLNPPSPLYRWASVTLGGVVLVGTLLWAYGFTSIYRNTNTRVAATRWMFQNVPAPFNLAIETDDGRYNEPLPAAHVTTLSSDSPTVIGFTARVTGTVTSFFVPHAASPYNPEQTGVMRVVLAEDLEGLRPLAEVEVTVGPAGADPHGGPVSVALGPAPIQGGLTYYVRVSTASGGPVEITGNNTTNENWDEAVPVRMDGRDPFGGLYRGLTMEMHWHDDENKRQMLISNLAQADYIVIPSQRRLWASTRLPATYPMTIAYYRALFEGRLGFDLIAQFQSPIVIGPLQISSEAATVAWGMPPANPPPGPNFPLNDRFLAAEEAFSVYDHAPVWIFQKRADYSQAGAEAILNAVDLSTVANQGPRSATETPTLLRLPADRLAALRAGGTWSAMFNFDGLLNRYQWLGVIAWYLTLLVVGWVALPLAYRVFSGLSDRGYTLIKTLSLLVVTWLVWIAGSYQVMPYARGTIVLGFLALTAVSGFIYWRRRAEINSFLLQRRRYMLVVEGVFLAFFVFDLLLRLGNPDLWHPNFGGEKPMVFSFFNAVLKSESFPPYNPWLAGYYLNYYYYGFVIVGVLTKLLGIVPAFAYNLILPTLFALVGINAFGVAYNLAAWKNDDGRRTKDEDTPLDGGSELPDDGRPATGDHEQMPAVGSQMPAVGSPTPAMASQAPDSEGPALQTVPSGSLPETSAVAPRASTVRLPTANPYLAGLAAAILVVVLGNLAQVHTLLAGFQRVADRSALANSVLGDNGFSATLSGFWRVVTGEANLPLGTGNWYWDATRIVTSLVDQNRGEITEFPFFTFLYADLHAHMIDMPFTLLSLGWAVSYLLGARAGQRRGWLGEAALFIVGGLALGMARATNTWDYPLFLILGALAVIVGEWLRRPRLSRALLVNLGWRLAALLLLATLFYRPFDQWFSAAYGELDRFEGNHIPVTAYLYVHGLFLFILTSYLVWETRRWLAETPATVLTRAGDWLPIVLLFLFVLAAGVVVLWYVFEIKVGLIILPLMAWAGLLLLRSAATMPLPRRIVLFLLGTTLAVTLFVEFFTLEGDRMNTIFKFYIQVWVLFGVAAGAALAWLWATLPRWSPGWRVGWTGVLTLLVAAAGLYTVTASAAKLRDRFPAFTAIPDSGCAPLAGMTEPNTQSLPPDRQPHSLYGLDYMKWAAYCDHESFLPLAYDHDAIRWMQDNVVGSPVIVEAQSFDLYRMSSRYAWNTGLPDVVGWDYHTRQHNAAVPTEFVTNRGYEIIAFYTTTSPDEALRFIQKYDARYVVVGPMEQAYYRQTGGLDKFDALVSRGDLTIQYQNPGVTIYSVPGEPLAGQ